MDKIVNSWLENNEANYNCFVCAPNNHAGLKMEFYEDGEEVVSFWRPDKDHDGWPGTVHGGIQVTMMDELGMWLVNLKLQTAGFTRDLTTKYIKGVSSDAEIIEVRARLKEVDRMFAFVTAKIIVNGEVCTEAEMKYFIVPQQVARTKFHFKGCFTESHRPKPLSEKDADKSSLA
ncbi:MAG: PaaI family thioesterase [Bacteroidales bacterium]|nr:PaaI family thioesterase [Bacteroidales bacterium]